MTWYFFAAVWIKGEHRPVSGYHKPAHANQGERMIVWRYSDSAERWEKFMPVFKPDGTVTAGHPCRLNDEAVLCLW